jgi:hypothetical protein
MAISIREATSVISEFVRSDFFPGVRFEKYDDRHYVSYVSDELKGVYLEGFGGDYESSISVGYSQGRGLYIEIYFSSKKGRMFSRALPAFVKEGLRAYEMDRYVSCDFTSFIHGDSALTCTLSTNPYSVDELVEHLSVLGEFIYDMASRIH